MFLYNLQDVQKENKDEVERTQTKNHTWTFATQPSVVEQSSVPVIIEDFAPVVIQVPDMAPPQVQFQLPWQIVYPLSSKLSLYYFDIYTLYTCLKGLFCLG